MSQRAFDQASELEQAERQAAWQAHHQMMEAQAATPSAKRCAVCHDPIPQERREASPGCQTCVHCQAELDDALNRHHY